MPKLTIDTKDALNRSRRIKFGILLFLSAVLSGYVQGKGSGASPVLRLEKGDAANVLLITIDTLRYDRLSLYSNKYVKTPNIDRLAKESFVFDRAFAHNPVTLPSHTNILTGTTPLYHGISDNTGFRLEERFITIAELLKKKGYETGAFIGAFPLDSRFGLNRGFDVYDDNYGTHGSFELFFVERTAEKVIKPARQWVSERKGKWFTWIHLFDPHQPYLPPPPFDTEYKDDPYSGECAYVDKQLGNFFSFLRDKKLLKKTIVIITGDHGEGLGEKGESTHSYFAYNSTIHIPLIIYVPGGGSKRIETNVSHVDIFPTICDLLGVGIPGHIQGESLLPVVGGKKKQKGKIYFESLTPYLNRGWAPLRGFIAGKIKFIDLPIREVYDLEKDIKETKNLVGTSDIRKMSRELENLKNSLSGKYKARRSEKIDPEVRKRLRSLGYISEKNVVKKSIYTRKDDLKTLLPLQNKMLDAMAKYQEGKAEMALKDLSGVIKESPAFILVYNRMAEIYKETGRVPEGINILRMGLKENPGNLNIMSKLGIFLAEENQPREAIDVLKACTAQNDFNPENFNFLGVAYYKSGNFDLALHNYRKALGLDHNYAAVFNNIGSLYLTAFLKNKEPNAYNLAIENFNKAIDLDPNIFSAYNGRGAAYLYGNKVKKAIADWQKAIEIKPDYTDPYFSIGIAYLRTGNKARALDIFRFLKEKYYSGLSPGDRQRLDRLIAEVMY
ncbi:MAG: sulfatase-like hydrolase/transferase [Candidatus Aminicenantes bacterium]|nr:sulfatase-like hydrolase/transferase [Candidatus Aminicenantes bacterium]